MASGLTSSPHTNASAGSIIKKIHEINPELGVQEISYLIRSSVTHRMDTQTPEDYTGVEIIDEEKALRLARLTLDQPLELNS